MYGLFIYLHLGIVQGLGGFHEGKYDTIHIEHLGMIAHEFSLQVRSSRGEFRRGLSCRYKVCPAPTSHKWGDGAPRNGLYNWVTRVIALLREVISPQL